MGRIFDLCFMMVMESVAFANYPSLLELGKRHGVDLATPTPRQIPLNYLQAS